MSSPQTYQLRDIVMLMNEGLESLNKSNDSLIKTMESSNNIQQVLEGLKEVHTHHKRAVFRLGVAYDKLVKGAKLEEEKEERAKQEK